MSMCMREREHKKHAQRVCERKIKNKEREGLRKKTCETKQRAREREREGEREREARERQHACVERKVERRRRSARF